MQMLPTKGSSKIHAPHLTEPDRSRTKQRRPRVRLASHFSWFALFAWGPGESSDQAPHAQNEFMMQWYVPIWV